MFSLGKALVRLMKVTQSLTSWPWDVHPRPSSIKRFRQTSRFPPISREPLADYVMYSYLRDCCHLSHLGCHFLPTCFLIAALFLCHSLCCGHAVKECGTSFTETGFSSVRQPTPRPTPLPPPPPSSPLLVEPTQYADKTLLMFFGAFFFCCEPRYSLIYDLAFSGFRWTSHHFPPKPDSHVGIWWGPQNAERVAIFFSPPRPHPLPYRQSKLQTSFSSPVTLLCYSPRRSLPFRCPPHLHSILNNIYI